MIESLERSLKKIINSTKEYFSILEKANIITVKDLLLYFPRKYEFQNQSGKLSDIKLNAINSIEAKIVDFSASLSRKTNKWFYKAILEDEEGDHFEAVWFSKPFQLSHTKEGEKKRFVGKIKFDFGKFSMVAPKIESLSETLYQRTIIPIYPQIDKITSDWFLKKIKELLSHLKYFSETLPSQILKQESLMDRVEALKQIHLPENEEKLQKAKERLAFEELFQIQIEALKRKQEFQKRAEKHNIKIPLKADLVKQFFELLPFTPTNAQKIAIFEILKDMEQDFPMSRLLEGDVGSGKTLVAITVLLSTISAGYQVALMAPTEVLARQHFTNIKNLLKDCQQNTDKNKENEIQSVLSKIKFGILFGSQKKKEKQETLLGILSGEINCVIGTHALIQESVQFEKLGLAIIDEQHRFGVEQRKVLFSQGSPHTLSMTATPIPRTLALVAYGDQDLSVLNELPPGRQEIISRVVNQSGRLEVSRFIDSQIENGRQVYVICPLINESKAEIMMEVKSVMEEYERLKELFPKRTISYLHGKLSSEEKQEIFNNFKQGETNILVSTSVIEVGIDVANATIMIIEGAERFGLSQLHQFRGRVGRGEHQSYCFLFTSKKNDTNYKRLTAMEKYSDGFRLAEIDLRLRGPGEVYGVRQSGIPDLKMAMLTDQQFVYRVRNAALEFLEKK